MSKIVILSRKKIQMYTIIAAIVILAGAYIGWQQSRPAMAPANDEVRVVQLVTGEFTSTSDSGAKLESYRWDPGTIFLKKGEPVELHISGINGQSHPFFIEGLNISGTVNKGKTTIVRFTPKDAGIYRLVCETHADPKDGIPMIGYVIVQ